MFCLFLTVSLFFIQPCWPGSGASQQNGHRAGAPTRHFGVDRLFRKPGDLGIPAALALPREPGSTALVSARARRVTQHRRRASPLKCSPPYSQPPNHSSQGWLRSPLLSLSAGGWLCSLHPRVGARGALGLPASVWGAPLTQHPLCSSTKKPSSPFACPFRAGWALSEDLPPPHSSTPAAAATAPVQARCGGAFVILLYWKANLVSAHNYAMFLISEKTDWMP